MLFCNLFELPLILLLWSSLNLSQANLKKKRNTFTCMKTFPTIKANTNSTSVSVRDSQNSSVINCSWNIGIASQINLQYLPNVKQSLWCPTAKVLVTHSFTLFTFLCYRMDKTILFLSETKLIEIATVTGILFNKLLGLQ